MKTTLTIILASQLLGLVISKKIGTKLTSTLECNENNRITIDKMAARLISVGANGRPFPTNQTELAAFCRESLDMSYELSGYVEKCFNDELRSFAKILIFTSKGVERKFCKRKAADRSRRVKQLIASASCINKYIRLNDTCVKGYFADLETLVHLPATYDNVKMPYVCCRYVNMLACVEKVFELSPQKCVRASREVVMDFLRGLFQSLVDISCGDYNDQSDRCNSLPAFPKLKLPSKRKSYFSQMFLIIDLFLSIKKEDRNL